MRSTLICSLAVMGVASNVLAGVVQFTSRANGSWGLDATWDQSPDPDPGDPAHVYPRLGDTANISHNVNLGGLQETSALNFGGGTITMGANFLTLHAPGAWTAGTFSGSSGSLVLNAGAGLSLTGASAKRFYAGTLLSSAEVSLSAGSLIVNGSMIDLSGGGTLSILSSANNATFATGTRVRGGTLAGDGTLTVSGTVSVDTISISGLNINVGTADALVLKNTASHSGTIRLQDTGSGYAVLRIDGNVALTGGGGRIVMVGATDNRVQAVNAADVLTLGAGQTITAIAGTTTSSQIDVAMINNGLVEADAGNLALAVNAKTNNAIMRSLNGGALHINGITLTNAGTLTASGASTISLDGATIIGGRIDGGGTVNVAGSATFDGGTSGAIRLDNVTIEMNTGDVLTARGTITNNGLIQIRDTGGLIAELRLAGDLVIDGTGSILLTGSDDQRITSDSEPNVLTIGPSQLVTTGAGTTLDNQINARVSNQGIIEANTGRLVLDTYGKTNLNLMRAINGGTLEFAGITVNNSGTITAEAGSAIDLNSATIIGGRIDGTGTVEVSSSATLDGSTAAGAVRIDNATFDINTGEVLRLNGQVTNNSLIQLRDTGGGVAELQLAGNALLDGTGSVLFAAIDDQRITTDDPAFVLTVGPAQTFTTGAAANEDSQINARVVNKGVIEASVGRLVLMTYDKENHNLLRARNGGTLEIGSITIVNNGTITAEAGSFVQLDGATIAGGRIDGAGTIDVYLNDAVLDSTVSPVQLDGVTFDMNASEDLTIRGGLVNNATLQLRDTGSGYARLMIDGSQTITGTGTIAFAGAGNNQVLPVTADDVLTIAPSQHVTTLSGTNNQSEIGITLINQGTIEPLGGALVLNGGPKTNQGIIRPGAGGNLILSATTLENVGAGTIQILSGGMFSIVSGGTLNTAAMYCDGTLQVNAARANVGNLTGSGTIVLVAGAASQLTATHLRASGLVVNGSSATAKILPNGGPAGTSRLNSVSVLGSGKFDLTDNDLVIDYTDTSPVQSIRTLIRNGYNAGGWNGGGMITSLGSATELALGFGEASALFGTFPATFSGQQVDNTSILVKYTYFGDATLDGKVDVGDLGKLATNWQKTAVWDGGDFNYDGTVNVGDLGLLATNWQKGVSNPPPLGPSVADALAAMGLPNATVPEPAGAAMIAVTAFLMKRRRGRMVRSSTAA